MTASARWAAAGLAVEPTYPRWSSPLDDPAEARRWGLRLHLPPSGGPRSVILGPELARSLHSWLGWWLGDLPAPSDPDTVRRAVDEARAALAARSMQGDATPEYRTGLAWCDHWLDHIAAAAEGTR